MEEKPLCDVLDCGRLGGLRLLTKVLGLEYILQLCPQHMEEAMLATLAARKAYRQTSAQGIEVTGGAGTHAT
jgi:hypothetical protein